MKQSVRNFVALSIFAMALTGLSLGQDGNYCVAANIPFDFYAGDQQLPAGTYLFNVSYETHLVSMRNHDTGRTYMVLAAPADGKVFGEAVVEFDVIGGSYMLADLKTDSAGVNFTESKRGAAQRHGSAVAALRSVVAVVR